MNFKSSLSTGAVAVLNTLPEVAQAVEITAVAVNSWLVELVNEDAVESTKRYASIRDGLRAARNTK